MLFTNFHLHVIYFPVGSWVTKHNRVLLLRIMYYCNSYVSWNGHLFSSRYACTLFILLCRWIMMSRVVIWYYLLNHMMGKSLAQSMFTLLYWVLFLETIGNLHGYAIFMPVHFNSSYWWVSTLAHYAWTSLVVISVGSAKLFALTKSYTSYLVVSATREPLKVAVWWLVLLFVKDQQHGQLTNIFSRSISGQD